MSFLKLIHVQWEEAETCPIGRFLSTETKNVCFDEFSPSATIQPNILTKTNTELLTNSSASTIKNI